MSRIILRKAELPEGMVKTQIVLCHLTHNTGHPFCTWQQNLADAGEDGTEGMYWGHYFTTYREAEDDFKERAVKNHAKTRKPFNLDVHAALVAEGFMLIQHESDWHEVGNGETGPILDGHPAWDEYLDKDYTIAIDNFGEVNQFMLRDLEGEAYAESMSG